jgi:arsenate reductase
MAVLYHNPRCSKSRAAVALCEASSTSVTIHCYLTTPLTQQMLEGILTRLAGPLSATVRTKDSKFKEVDASDLDLSSVKSVALFLSNHGHLMERPLYDTGIISVIGRPLENIEAHL